MGDARPMPKNGATFEGWFHRVVDFEENISVAFIIGEYKAPGFTNFAQTWVGLLTYGNGRNYDKTEVTNIFINGNMTFVTKNGSEVTKRSEPSDPAKFRWQAEGIGFLDVNDDSTELLVTVGDLFLHMETSNRIPWDKSCPNSCGPEGYLQNHDNLLPCSYAVQSLHSNTKYSVQEVGSNNFLVDSTGISHIEGNYGSAFPSEWIWVQAFSSDHPDFAFVFTTGAFQIGPLVTNQTTMGYRSRNFHWDLRSIDLDTFKIQHDGCKGTMNFTVVSKNNERKLEVNVSAPVGSFGDALYAPGVGGFSNKPGAKESYAGQATFRAHDSNGTSEMIESTMVAFEFGGKYICDE